ncbi:MAG TPA: prolyl oligopeptidase family serine peptidase, partial [Burkholderiales bacterium]|nr:prolyl oligopeptidase family serine peptidase [Burkholderiales bacterium]
MYTRDPYGSWKSPITADTLVADSLGLGQVVLDGSDIYWGEMRPIERGRNAVVRLREGRTEDVLPAPFSARSRVHEYGGGAFTVSGATLYFCNDADQQVYRVDDDMPMAITSTPGRRYADLTVDRSRRRLIAVCEDHTDARVENSLIAIDIDGKGQPTPLVRGADFYAAPRVSPDGRQLAWLSWSHPDMPWDGTELWLADLAQDGTVTNARRIAGGRNESILQPAFAPDNTLYFVSDRDDWWNLYRRRDGRTDKVVSIDAEIGWPQWVFGESAYAFLSAQLAILGCNYRGVWRLGLLHLDSDRLEWLSGPCNEIHSLVAGNGRAVFVGSSEQQTSAVLRFDAATRDFDILRRATAHAPEAGYLASPETIEFPTAGGETAHGFFYPPTNRDAVAPRDERPPLLVLSHGGPTAAASPALNLRLQYWTSRGFAVLDVNYRGSTGFGRRYRRALYGQWGIADVEDCLNGVRFLIQRGDVDAERIAIRGGSAGGYTTLCALTFHELFRAGAVYYGVSDLEALARETHKFEQHYTDQLV